MYAFLDLAVLGAVIALRRQWLLIIWPGLELAHVWAARREGWVLETAFREAYREYRAQAWCDRMRGYCPGRSMIPTASGRLG